MQDLETQVVPSYTTKIQIPPDRYLCLQLPERFPTGWATVTVQFAEDAPGDIEETDDSLVVDRDDVEWWEEFDDYELPL